MEVERRLCDIAQKKMEKDKKVVDAMCNVSVLIILAGILLCVLADSQSVMMVAFLTIEIGCIMCFVSGYIHERMQPMQAHVNFDKQDKEDIKAGKYNDMYEPIYLFRDYLMDNSCTMQELIEILERADNKESALDYVYINYKNSARGSKVQSRDHVAELIKISERRQKAG